MDTKESSANASVAGATAQQSQNGVVGSVKGSAKSDTNYVFCSAEGQAVVLSEHEHCADV